MQRRTDLTGQRFGRWTVIGPSARTGAYKRWLCRCECGQQRRVIADNLERGRSTSCGCHLAEILRHRTMTHGQSNTPEHAAWRRMHSRCYNSRVPSFPCYGGRGISVCRQWHGADGFIRFAHDMGQRPSSRHSLDRIDNNGNYAPDNCRWATMREQALNRRTANIIEANGVRRHLTEWATMLGASVETIRGRLRRGWSPEEAVTAPPFAHGGRGRHALCASTKQVTREQLRA
jgi:hypothetical protein